MSDSGTYSGDEPYQPSAQPPASSPPTTPQPLYPPPPLPSYAAAPQPDAPAWSAPVAGSGIQWANPTTPTSQWEQAPAGTPGWGIVPPPPAPAKRRRGRWIVLGVVAALVAVAAAVGAFLVLGSSSEKFTYNGTKIATPAKVLSATEASLDSIVTSRHGATTKDTRCYFAKLTTAPAGKPASDVDRGVRCGPVLFVDGNTADEWTNFPLTPGATSGGAITLATPALPAPADPVALDPGIKLSRPDGKKPPKNITLAVPQPPVADAKTFLVSDLGPTTPPKQLPNARIGSLNVGLRLVSAGIVPRYGAGDAARRTPPGSELIAFQIDSERGENGSDSGFSDFLKLKDSFGSRLVPTAPSDEYVIVAEPVGAKPQLVVTDAGYTQTLSLPDGTPGKANLTVLSRNHRFSTTTQKVDVTLNASGPGGSDSQTFHATADGASLVYWPPLHQKDHPAHPNDAFLIVPLTYVDPNDTSEPFGFDSELLSVRLPDGRVVQGQNIATDADHVLTVFEVPGTFTKGTVVISGSESLDGVTISVASPVNVPVSITAN